MASILLTYVDSDKATASALAKLLARERHTVHTADHKVPASRSREDVNCVIVIWSAAAVTSPYVYEDARVALKLNKLVQVFSGDFDPTTLAPVFRAQPLISIEDTKQILRLTADFTRISFALGGFPTQEVRARREHLRSEPEEVPEPPGPEAAPVPKPMQPYQDVFTSTPETREAFGGAEAREEGWSSLHEPTPRKVTPPPIPSALCRAALEKQAGQLTYQVPKTMRRGATEIVEVRLGLAHRKMTIGFMGSGDVAIENLPIVETMTVNLYGSPGAFQITRQSRETQLVMGSLIGNASLDHDRFGRWLWHITPKMIGTHDLTIKVSANLSDSRGVATSEPYRDRMFSVTVRVNFGSASARVLKWATAGAVTGLAGAYTHDVWWPKVKVWLTGAGLLS